MDGIAKQTKIEDGKCYDQGMNKVMGEKEWRKEVVTECRVTPRLEMGNFRELFVGAGSSILK